LKPLLLTARFTIWDSSNKFRRIYEFTVAVYERASEPKHVTQGTLNPIAV
jgi:hypothetical protein